MYQDAKDSLKRLQALLEEEPQEETASCEEPSLEELFADSQDFEDYEQEPEEYYEEPYEEPYEESYEEQPGSSGRGIAALAVGAVVVSVAALCVLLWWILRQRGLL